MNQIRQWRIRILAFLKEENDSYRLSFRIIRIMLILVKLKVSLQNIRLST